MPRPSDPRYAAQWHFRFLGNIERVWDEYSGAGVSVGVFDDGLQYSHPDLNAQYDASLHFTHAGITYDAAPITLSGPGASAHGTAVAGIIAAVSGNGLGGVGVAAGAILTGVNLLSDQRLGSNALLPLVLRHGAAFDIMSNSWAYRPHFKAFQNLADPGSLQGKLADAYDHVASSGRGGLGTIVVQAAGNSGLNASGSGLNTSRHIISVAAHTATGEAADYSNRGINILVSAAAASVTTDLIGKDGYNKTLGSAGDYMAQFGGTSAATPVVSGVVALMLEANPDLGWRDVQEILATSARLTGDLRRNITAGGVEVQKINTRSGDGWQRDGDTWNDGGRVHAQNLGFGRVDAFAAVRLAEAWGLTHKTAQNSANERHVHYSDAKPHQMVNSGGGDQQALRLNILQTRAMTVEHIAVTLDFDYATATMGTGNLDLALISPTGTRLDLYQGMRDAGHAPAGGGLHWRFGSVVAWGQNLTGTWTLQLTDRDQKLNPTVGVLSGFSIDFYGAAKDVDDTHYITQDFALIHRLDKTALRDKIIDDSNVGVDWLNMAMLGGNVVASLVAGARFSVDRAVWGRLAAGAKIENLISGDGADRLTGSAAANEIHAMRGDDIIQGGAGDDWIYGGTGRDALRGDAGADHLYGGAGNDSLHGGAGNDALSGDAGADTLTGDLGDDTLDGGALTDQLTGGAGSDQLSGGEGADRLYGDADADRMFGDAGNDMLFGGAGHDSLFGGDGNDTLSDAVGGGNDLVQGGRGRDLVLLGAGDDRFDDDVEAGPVGSDTVWGGAGHDTLTGRAGNDSLLGEAGNDLITGGAGNDTLHGGTGFDLITGGAGSDLLTGGLEADQFVFHPGDGADRIADFRDNVDSLTLDVRLWAGTSLTVAEVVATYAVVLGVSVVFRFGAADVLTLTGLHSLAVLHDDITLL